MSDPIIPRGIVIEADAVLFGSLKTAAAAMSEKLEKVGIKADEFTFLRTVFGSSFKKGFETVEPAFDKRDIMHELAAEAKAAWLAGLQQNASVSDAFTAFARAAFAEGLEVVLLTRLHPDVLEELFAPLAAEGSLHVVADSGDCTGVVCPDAWRKALARGNIAPQNAAALCASGSSLRGALTVGMHGIVIIDPLAAFEDCGGANIVTETLDPALIGNIKCMLKM